MEAQEFSKTPEAKKAAQLKEPKGPGLIAVVRYHTGPETTERPLGFIHARTKRDMASELKSANIAEVVAVIRGRKLQHSETRAVKF